MGGRGSFLDVGAGDFRFVEGGQTYHTIGMFGEVKVLARMPGHSVKAPEYSHSPNRVYAVVQDGQLKHLAFYNSSHDQVIGIDFMHKHSGISPHKHYFRDHSGEAYPLTEAELRLAANIRRRFGLR